MFLIVGNIYTFWRLVCRQMSHVNRFFKNVVLKNVVTVYPRTREKQNVCNTGNGDVTAQFLHTICCLVAKIIINTDSTSTETIHSLISGSTACFSTSCWILTNCCRADEWKTISWRVLSVFPSGIITVGRYDPGYDVSIVSPSLKRCVPFCQVGSRFTILCLLVGWNLFKPVLTQKPSI